MTRFILCSQDKIECVNFPVWRWDLQWWELTEILLHCINFLSETGSQVTNRVSMWEAKKESTAESSRRVGKGLNQRFAASMLASSDSCEPSDLLLY